nr:MAG TPA: hypothetical protein [Caudoviricetes sp.]
MRLSSELHDDHCNADTHCNATQVRGCHSQKNNKELTGRPVGNSLFPAGLFVFVHGSASFPLMMSLTAASIFSRMPCGLRLPFRIIEQ